MIDGDCTNAKHKGCCCPHGRKHVAACAPCEMAALRERVGDAADHLIFVGWKLKDAENEWAVRNVLLYDPTPRDDWEPIFTLSPRRLSSGTAGRGDPLEQRTT